MKRKCPPGKYYCYTDKKCKKIPKGFKVVGRMGYLRRENGFSKDEETKKNGNGSSNGNGNGGNGSGNGNGGSGGNGGGNGMGESIVYEASNPRIPRKPGQPAKSKKHSDLYTDEDPKGTIHGLGFKNVAKARASVSKIRNSSRSHAHKIQAAVAMEQRAREMGKTSEAAVYRKYINSMKKKTKRMNEAVNAAQQAAIAINMKKRGKKPKSMKEAVVTDDSGRVPSDGSNAKLSTDKMRTRSDGSRVSDSKDRKFFKTDGSRVSDSKDRKLFKTDGSRVTRTEGMYNHTDVGLITNAVVELEDGLKTLKTITYDSVDQLMQGIAKRNDISPTLLHNQFKAKHLTIPDDWAIRYRMNKMKGIEEAKKMTKKQIKKRDEIADAISTREMNKRYGDKNVKYAIATKLAMKEESQEEMLARVRAAQAKMDEKSKKKKVEGIKDKVEIKPTDKPENQFNSYELSSDDKYNVSEEGLRDWFGKSSGTTKSGRKVRGWVQVGGKYDGKPCARQPGQKSTPKCVSSAKRRSMSKSERDSAARRKRAADPNQPQKSGAAKPTNVSTDPKKKMSENYFNEAKDKKGKGSGTKDACYHKVKSRYSVWPSAYASGALVKCRKVGAANWGNKTKKEGFSPMQVAALEAAGMIELNEAGKKCWKGYKKAGTQKLFGKTYNRCVKAGDELNHDGQSLQEKSLEDFERESGVKAVKPKKEVELPKTPEKKSEGTFASGNPVGKENVKRKMLNVSPGSKREVASRGILGKIKHVVTGEEYAPVTEGVAFLKREKEKKNLSPSI